MKKVKWGIIGTGKIARRFASDLRLLKSAELVGVTSRNPENCLKFGVEFNTKSFTSVEDLLASDVDIIYVATPHSSHRDHSMMAIEAGKSVLCEKPFAMNIQESREMIERATQKHVFLMEAMWTRFFPVIKEVVHLVKSGQIGKVLRIEARFGYQTEFDPHSRVFDPMAGGGSLLDVGVYCASLTRMFIEEKPLKIEANAAMSSTGVDESVSWSLVFPSGGVATCESSVVKVLSNEARIIGTTGEIHIPKFWCPKEYFLNGSYNNFEFNGSGFQFEAEEVMNCLRSGLVESPLLTHQHVLDVMQTMDSIRESIGLQYPQD